MFTTLAAADATTLPPFVNSLMGLVGVVVVLAALAAIVKFGLFAGIKGTGKIGWVKILEVFAILGFIVWFFKDPVPHFSDIGAVIGAVFTGVLDWIKGAF